MKNCAPSCCISFEENTFSKFLKRLKKKKALFNTECIFTLFEFIKLRRLTAMRKLKF